MKQLSLLIALLMLLSYASELDYREELTKASRYHRMVCAGVWHPYDGVPDCTVDKVGGDNY